MSDASDDVKRILLGRWIISCRATEVYFQNTDGQSKFCQMEALKPHGQRRNEKEEGILWDEHWIEFRSGLCGR